MRILEPAPNSHKKLPHRSKRRFALYGFILICVSLTFFFFMHKMKARQNVDAQNNHSNQDISDPVAQSNATSQDTVKDTLRNFTDNEFRLFYDNVRQAGVKPLENPPVISGNDIADTRIRSIAELRGYKLRNTPTTSLVPIDGQKLQADAATAWEKMKQEASNENLAINLVSGYRSVDDQRQLFLQRLSATGVSIEDVAEGLADAQINKVLTTTSIPGYSKHHTGYTLDLFCAGFAFEKFKDSTCHTWLSNDNYKNAKLFGFIPSYPSDADGQGPDPEAWEYVYVGTELLYE
ncbi:MAG TPA: D-alanyl-D-alanine carboxypeptidase family protein [Candidatus Saccharibacteria bacterium]|jgi:hypothetical protein|nr:D-alanyl-D-alanine carboxypeptidase family protein [Candidatus Saccharibacteria bacterium]